MTRFFGCGAAALGAALIWASPAAAVRSSPPAAIAAPVLTEEAQFRLPWEQRTKPKRRAKPSPRAEKQRPKAPAAVKRGRDRRPVVPASPVDPMDAALPALATPLGLALRGDTRREADHWAALSAEAPPPPNLPPLPADGPAPAPAYVAAILASLPRGDMSGIVEGPDDVETPDMHMPLPPVRPPAPGEPVAAIPTPSDLPPSAPDVPLPTARPGPQTAAVEPTAPLPPQPPLGPTAPAIPLPTTSHAEDPDCAPLKDPAFAVSEEIPPIEGPGACGGGPLVQMTGVKRKDGGLIRIRPAATLRCGMAKELADFLRDDLAPAAKLSGAELERLDIAGSFQCRGRNGAAGGKMSEHGRANAVDLAGFGLSDGRNFDVFASDLPQDLAAKAKSGACERFSTVLGPGSDGFHETHLHIDLQPRRSKAKMCQWSDPEVAKAKAEDEQEAEAPRSETGEADDKAEAGGKKQTAAKRKPDGADETLPKGAQTP